MNELNQLDSLLYELSKDERLIMDELRDLWPQIESLIVRNPPDAEFTQEIQRLRGQLAERRKAISDGAREILDILAPPPKQETSNAN